MIDRLLMVSYPFSPGRPGIPVVIEEK